MHKLLPLDYAVRNLGRSRVRLAASVLGAALVATLVLGAAAFVRGMERSLTVAGESRNVILLGAGSEESIERSEIGANVAGLLAASVPGIRSRLGVPYVSPEVHVMLVIRTDRDRESPMMAVVRGVTPPAFLVHAGVRMIEGRAPQAGSDEIAVGALTATTLGIPAEQLAVGRTLWFGEQSWKIVGRFDASGTIMNAEIWCPLTDLMTATRRKTVSAIFATLDDAEFADVDAFCKQRLDLELVALRERDYYRRLLTFYKPIRAMVWVTAGLIAVGGLMGGLNTMYAAFASRVRELATLQTLGFARAAIVVSLAQESLLMALMGTIIAAGVGLRALDGLAVRFSMGAFGLTVDAPVVLAGMGAGLGLGLLGALPPAWRCLRMPVTDALRAA